MKKTCLLAVAAGMACCTVALAKPPIETARPGAEVQPVSIAKVAKVNGQIVRVGEWMPYTGGFGTRTHLVNAPFFDSFGRDPANSTVGAGAGTGCTTNCTTAWLDGHTDNGTRWYFGSGYNNPNTIEDMQDCACPASSVISEIDLGFFWCPQTPSDCIIIYFPLEEVLAYDPGPGLCNDPASFTDTGGGGVALNYGALPPGCPFYYYSRVAGIEGIGILSPAIEDGGDPAYADGSYQMIIAQAITSSAIILAGDFCQPMLWGTSTGWNGSVSTGQDLGGVLGDCRPGVNNDDSYDDDNPVDGTLDNPGECYAYNFGICPDPIGKDNAFCYLRCPADFNNDGFVDGIDADGFANCFEQTTTNTLPQSCADLNGDCFVDGIDGDLFNNEFEHLCP